MAGRGVIDSPAAYGERLAANEGVREAVAALGAVGARLSTDGDAAMGGLSEELEAAMETREEEMRLLELYADEFFASEDRLADAKAENKIAKEKLQLQARKLGLRSWASKDVLVIQRRELATQLGLPGVRTSHGREGR